MDKLLNLYSCYKVCMNALQIFPPSPDKSLVKIDVKINQFIYKDCINTFQV